jgi:hypothetical protein
VQRGCHETIRCEEIRRTHDRSWPVKKGRHRRFEEARALKRSSDINIEDIFESLQSERSDGDSDRLEPDDEFDDDADD